LFPKKNFHVTINFKDSRRQIAYLGVFRYIVHINEPRIIIVYPILSKYPGHATYRLHKPGQGTQSLLGFSSVKRVE
jgi:hypothetical protein